MPMDSIPDILDDIRDGKMVILMDDEDRENEGDLVIAAEKVTPEIINFFASEACGLICMPITAERARQLRIPLMVRDNRSQHETNFTVSIDATNAVGPGVSARQRAHTILEAVKPDASHADISQPGHIFPLVAKPGGVLQRAGHTEAGVDLARMAGCEPAAVIVEIMNQDGTMARRPELEVFAKTHGLRMGTIADLIEYRALHEQSVQCNGEFEIDTKWGPFSLTTFEDVLDGALHYALSRGDLTAADLPVRIQPVNTLRDLIGTKLPNSSAGWSYESAMQYVADNNHGLVILLGGWESKDLVMRNIEQITSEQKIEQAPQNYRAIGTGAQMLRHLGVNSMRVMSAPIKYNALSGFHLEVTGFITAPA